MTLGRDAAGIFAANAVNLVLSLASSVFLTRALGPEGRGEYAVFVASVGILTLLFGMGLDIAIRYFVAQERVPLERVLGSMGLFVLLVGFGVLGLARLNHLWLDNELFLPRPYQALGFELLLAAMVAGNLTFSVLSSVLAGLREFGRLNAASVAVAVLAVLVWGAVLGAQQVVAGIGTEEVLVAYVALQWLGAGGLTVLCWSQLGIRPSTSLLDRRLVGRMVRYASKAQLANVAQFLNYRIDIWIVQALLGSTPLGLYALAASLANLMWLLPRSVGTVLLPAVAGGDDPEGDFQAAARASRISFALVVAVGLLAAVAAPFFVEFLYGREFGGSVAPFLLLLLGAVPFSLSVVIAAALAGDDKVGWNVLGSVVGLVVTIVLDLVLIPRWGIRGAALASSASYLVTTLCLLVAFTRVTGIAVAEAVLPRREDLTVVLRLVSGLIARRPS